MPKSLVFSDNGGKKSLSFTDTPLKAAPQPGMALIRHTAIAATFYDLEVIQGLRPAPKLPFVPGVSATAIVERAGAGVPFKRGDRVVYIHPQGGAYCQARMIGAQFLHGIPDHTSDEIAAASFLRLMLAHSLLYQIYKVKDNSRILLTSAAGGVGHITAMLAKHMLGAQVYGLVSDSENTRFAEKCGAEIIDARGSNFIADVRERTEGKGIDVVYDGSGKDMADVCLSSLRPMGLYCAYGNSCGKPFIPPMSSIEKNSLFYTRPSVFLYKTLRKEAVLTSIDIFKWLEKGRVKPAVNSRFALQDIAKAHAFLRNKSHQGTAVITMR